MPIGISSPSSVLKMEMDFRRINFFTINRIATARIVPVVKIKVKIPKDDI